jgi:LmbE family N-acetylglucosaminyl deacetylase
MNPAAAILAALAARRRVPQRVMIVAAHPDDETLGLGAQLCRFDDALLVHATDGAPRDGEDARNYGFAAPAEYAAARRRELAAALRAGGADGLRTLCLGLPDKEAMADLAGLSRRIAGLFREENPAAVITHAYEGGHPDHDSVAFAVHAAGRLIDHPPTIIEFPLYHRAAGEMVTGIFPAAISPSPRPSPRKRGKGEQRRRDNFAFEDFAERRNRVPSPRARGEGQGEGLSPAAEEWLLGLDASDIGRKQAMLECFATQRWLFAPFDLSAERLRPAPQYDFRQPPHPGELHYETLGWGITGEGWRREAVKALDSLGLAAACP